MKRFVPGFLVGIALGLALVIPAAWCGVGEFMQSKVVVAGVFDLGALSLLVRLLVKPTPAIGRTGLIVGVLGAIGAVAFFFLSLAAGAGGHFG